jgi:hypothetical protein
MAPIYNDEQRRALALLTPDTLGAWASGGQWKAAKHLQFISERIERAVDAGNGRVVVNMPPRTGKSELLCKWTPIWFLENWPHKKVIITGHSAELSAGFGRQVRNEFATNPNLRTKLRDDSKAAYRWNTEQGGGLYAAGVGTGILGFGGDLICVDDPYPSWADAFSFGYRSKLEEWFGSSLMTRAEPNATVIVLHHRFHPEDLTSFLQNDPNFDWDVIKLPALAEANDPMGREPGESIWPERWPVDALNKKRGPHFEAMYGQNPEGVGVGALYKHFTEANVSSGIKFDPARPVVLAIDFNINPGMHALMGQYDPVADRFDVLGEIHEPRMDLDECLEAFIRWHKEQGAGRVDLYGDSSGRAGSVLTKNRSFYDVIADRFARASIPHWNHVPKANPPIFDRVTSVNEALKDSGGTIRVRIHPSCKRLLTDFREMRADEQGSIDKNVSKLSHASDAFGYWVHCKRPNALSTRQPKPGRFIFGQAS